MSARRAASGTGEKRAQGQAPVCGEVCGMCGGAGWRPHGQSVWLRSPRARRLGGTKLWSVGARHPAVETVPSLWVSTGVVYTTRESSV